MALNIPGNRDGSIGSSFDPKQNIPRTNYVQATSSPNYQGLEQQITGNIPQKNNSTVLKYPLDRQENYPAAIVFEPYIVDAYKVSTEGLRNIMDAPLVEKFIRGAATALSSTSDDPVLQQATAEANVSLDAFGGANTTKEDRANALRKKEQANALAARNAQIENNKKEMGNKLTDLRAYRDPKSPSMALYLPPGLQYVDAVAYNDTNIGPGGLSALAGINSRQGILSSLARGAAEGIESIFNLARGTLSKEAAQVAAARAANFIPSQGLQGAAAIGLQTGLNPGTRILFEKPAARRFVFSFKLIATSPSEAKVIEEIVKNFRYQLYPREIDINNIPIGYEFPNVFRISFKFGATGQQPHVPRLQYCYLESINTSYNGQADVFYEDGHPTEVDLSLNFVEYRPLSKRDVEAGF